jgi:ribulose-5-phosphate 4-epimerase/fuculose-1-phosphate aldolase
MTAEQQAVEQELRVAVATAGAILYHLGLADYMGHCSARVPGTDRIVIKPRHSIAVHGMGTVSPERMIVIDMDGKLVEGKEGPPAERFIHTEIYRRRPDVGGIIHTHQMMSVAFGCVERPILPLLSVEAPLVAKGIPIYRDPDLVDTPPKGVALAEALGRHEVVHIKNHGVVFAAPTIEEATLASIHLERLAMINYFAAQLGTATGIDQPKLDQMLAGPRVNYKVRFGYYKSLLDTGALDARAVVGAPPLAQQLNMAK